MRKHQPNGRLAKALAILISSTHTTRRPKPLTEVAHWLQVAKTFLGNTRTVAERIGLSPQMLRQFEAVDKLAPAVQKMFEVRKLDSVDAAAHLAMLESRDQLSVARLLATNEIDTSDVRAIYQLRKEGAKRPIRALIKQVSDSKTKQEYVAEFVIRGSQNISAVKNAFAAYIPIAHILRIEVEGVLGRLILDKSGKQSLAAAARSLGVPFKQVIPAILQRGRTK